MAAVRPCLSCTLVLAGLAWAAPAARSQIGEVLLGQRISSTEGGFQGVLEDHDEFGSSVATLGDLDGDGVDEIVVGAIGDDDGGEDAGAVWLLFMNNDGTVKSHRKIGEVDLGVDLATLSNFGSGVAALGDIDGNGIPDLAVGSPERREVPPSSQTPGSVWVLMLGPGGSIESVVRITEGTPGFVTNMFNHVDFGAAVAGLGDLDGNGVPDLVVGAPGFGASLFGAAWIVLLEADGTVAGHLRITDSEGGFGGELGPFDAFGTSVALLGDLDGDHRPEIAVGAPFDGSPETGAAWVISLEPDGTVAGWSKITEGVGGFVGDLRGNDRFGTSVGALSDMNYDGVPDLAVGAPLDDDGRPQTGAVWLLLMRDDLTVKNHVKISADIEGALGGVLHSGEFFGTAVAVIAEVGSTGLRVAFGAAGNDDGTLSAFADKGAVWVTNLAKALDSFGPECEIVDDISQTFATGTARDDRPSEDLDDSGQLEPGEDSNGNGFLDADSGIEGVSLALATNLELSVDPFVVGDPVVSFTVALADSGLPGSGTLRLRDVSGNVTTCPVNLAGAECFLVIGDAPGTGTFLGGNHVFATLVGPALDSYPVLMEDIPEFVLPTAPWVDSQGAAPGSAGLLVSGSPGWLLDGEFVVQVVMWNPIVFPQAPEGSSHGLYVRVLPDGQVRAVPFGSGTGLTVWAETDVDAHGQPVVRFPFLVPGL